VTLEEMQSQINTVEEESNIEENEGFNIIPIKIKDSNSECGEHLVDDIQRQILTDKKNKKKRRRRKINKQTE